MVVRCSECRRSHLSQSHTQRDYSSPLRSLEKLWCVLPCASMIKLGFFRIFKREIYVGKRKVSSNWAGRNASLRVDSNSFSTHATSSYENAPTDEFVGRLTSRSFWKQIKVTYQIRCKIGLCGLIWKALLSWIQNRNQKNDQSCNFQEICFQKL